MPPMPKQSEARQRLAQHLEDRRVALDLTWAEVASAAGITTETLRQVRYGNSEIRPLTRGAIERALGWRPGSIAEVLDGGDPMVNTLDVQKKISRHLGQNEADQSVGADDEDDPVLFLLTPEEHRRLDRLPAAERRRVLDAMRASARATADALLRTGDDQ